MDWSRGKTIGRGSSATVSIATSWKTGETFAVKSAELSKSKLLQREQNILSNLRCPQIVEYKGFDVTVEGNRVIFNLMMEHLPNGTLSHLARRHGGRRLDEPRIEEYIKQIVLGLDYLHAIGVVHCDIKGGNILLGECGAKIADFGCSKWLNPAAAAIGGTPMFMAPEVAQGKEQGFAADIWALGCTVIELAGGGSSPWPNIAGDPAALLYHIAFSGESPRIPDFLSNNAKDFLEKCFRRDPKERWTAKQLLIHPFLNLTENLSITIPRYTQNQERIIIISPTSVLDQGIWDSSSSSSSSEGGRELTQTITNSSDSPKQMVRQLCWNSCVIPTWEDDETFWITVRSRDFGAEANLELEVNFLQDHTVDSDTKCSNSYVPFSPLMLHQNIVCGNITLKKLEQRLNQFLYFSLIIHDFLFNKRYKVVRWYPTRITLKFIKTSFTTSTVSPWRLFIRPGKVMP